MMCTKQDCSLSMAKMPEKNRQGEGGLIRRLKEKGPAILFKYHETSFNNTMALGPFGIDLGGCFILVALLMNFRFVESVDLSGMPCKTYDVHT